MLVGADALMGTGLKFWKVQSIGNHFPLVLAEDTVGADLSDLALRMCAHHFGIGGDGLLVVERPILDVESAIKSEVLSHFKLRMFNPDGTEDFCGNGIRCAARFIVDQGWATDHFVIEHGGRKIDVLVEGDLISTILGSASYKPEDVPTSIHGELFNETIFAARVDNWSVVLNGSALSTGSTHVVLQTGALPDDDGFVKVSKMLENDPRFPQRTSVIWAVQEAESLSIRIWERGVGETFGCGTGSSAAAADWMRRRGCGGKIEVKNPGGSVFVSADRWDSPLTLSGSAEVLFEGEWD